MTQILPPQAKKQSVATPSKKRDAYHWLRADNWQEVLRTPDVLDSEIRSYIEAENTYTDAVMQPTKELQETIFQEIKGRIKEDDQSLPVPDGKYEYYSRYETGGQYPISCRRLRDSQSEEILFNFNEMGKDFEYFGIGSVGRSCNHRYIAYGLDTNGSEYYVVRFRDTDTGADLDDVLENTTGGVVWATNDAYVFYITLNENHRTDKVWRHKMGTSQSDDVLVYEEADSGFFLGIGMSESEDYIFLSAHDHITSETFFIKADDPLSDFTIITPRITGVEYDVSHHGKYFYISTNADGAVDFKIVRTLIDTPHKDNWTEYVPHVKGVLQAGHSVCAKYLLRMEKQNALPRIVIHDFATGVEKVIDFDEEAYALSLSGALEYTENIMRFSYSSPTTQNEVYDYDMTTDTRTLMKRQSVPSGHNPDDYETRRIYATSHDGVKIPLTIVYKKGLKQDGTNPVLLYGYGSYGHSVSASFSVTRLSLIDRGFVYAIAHIRGGMDCGYQWYLDGKLDKKKNTFHDFIACGQALIDAKYTRLGAISAMGGSAGGMLMGAIANMRSDMFKNILALVPFVDVLNTICDETLPLTPPEWNEWGNPLESEEVYTYIESYSPYDNVVQQHYPNMYIQAGLTDPRVTYWEPTKWVAKLREYNTNASAKIVMRTQMGMGHGGASGRFDSLRETAEEYAFLIDNA